MLTTLSRVLAGDAEKADQRARMVCLAQRETTHAVWVSGWMLMAVAALATVARRCCGDDHQAGALDACREMREQGVMPGLHLLVQLVEALAEQMLSVHPQVKVQTPSPEIVQTRRALAEGEVFLPRTDMGHDSLAGPVGPGCAWDQKSTKLTPAVRYPDGHVEVIEARFGGGGLSAEQESKSSCKNVGLDLACGACASLFYTGCSAATKSTMKAARRRRGAIGTRLLPSSTRDRALPTWCASSVRKTLRAQYCLDKHGQGGRRGSNEAGLAMYTLLCHISTRAFATAKRVGVILSCWCRCATGPSCTSGRLPSRSAGRRRAKCFPRAFLRSRREHWPLRRLRRVPQAHLRGAARRELLLRRWPERQGRPEGGSDVGL